MMLFAHALDGQIDYLQVVQFGVTYTPEPELPNSYRVPFGVFDVVALEDDAVQATFEGVDPLEWSKVGDLYRFIFPDVGGEPEPEGGVVHVAVTDGLRVNDHVGG